MASPSTPVLARGAPGSLLAADAPRGPRAPRGGTWSRRARVGRFLLVGSMAGALGNCRSELAPTGGSEPHFLRLCDADCPGELECVCGACTAPCARAADCAGWADAADCVPSAVRVLTRRCPATTAPAFCDRSCLFDADCAALGEEHRCVSGYCRRSDGDVAPPVSGGEDCAPAPLAADELVVLGDSLLTLSVFTSELEAVAVAAGGVALGADEHLRDYSSELTSMLAEGPLGIQNQYAASVAEGPARVVILNGGATDMLQDTCPSGPALDCPAVQAAALGAERLLARMADDGVQHVVYFFYADATANDALRAGIDVLRPLVENACGRSPVPCHWLDLRPVFAGHYAEYVTGVDGIVFSDAGARAAAEAIWSLVEERCIAP